MYYDERNRAALDTLAPNTKAAAYAFYDYCIKYEIPVLITEGIRTKARQRQLIRDKKSKTMKSYHIVGQAFDFVPVINDKGEISYAHYRSKPWIDAVNYAKSIGFEWGGDWGWDSPHLQFNYKGYGTDNHLTVSFASIFAAARKVVYTTLEEGHNNHKVRQLQLDLNALGINVGEADGIFGRATKNGVMIYQRRRGLLVDGIAGKSTLDDLEVLLTKKGLR